MRVSGLERRVGFLNMWNLAVVRKAVKRANNAMDGNMAIKELIAWSILLVLILDFEFLVQR